MKKIIAFLLAFIMVMAAIPMNMSAITYDDFSTGTFVSFIPSSSTAAASNDNTYIQINFDDNGHKLVDNPILKIYYRSNIAASAAKLDINAGVLYNGASTRMWGNALNYTKDGSLQSITIDLTKALTGGEKISSVNSADEGTPITYLRLKPYNYNQTITPGDYFDIESIAFYSSLEEAAIDGMPTFEKPADGKIGDADGDGTVTILDLIVLARNVADWNGYEYSINFKASDVNSDGYVNLVDPIIIARYMADWGGYDKYFK